VTTRVAGAVRGRADAEAIFRTEDCSAPRAWGNAPGDRYGAHSHDYHKVLFCLNGSITFHLADGDVELSAGDRLDLPPGTEHSATVGPDGVECIEASR
jgi:mannose-6-phosphate isomerase-like protein (cupin superfamily)